MPDTIYTTTSTELTSVANAIRSKGNTSEPLEYPNGFVEAIETLEGSGSGQLYIFVYDSPNSHTYADITGSGALNAPKAYYGSALVSGATVNFYTFGDWILDYITGWDSGNTYPFTTVTRGQYTFTMPSESVECHLLYDD